MTREVIVKGDSIPDEYVREAVDKLHGILTNLRTRLDRASNGAHAAPERHKPKEPPLDYCAAWDNNRGAICGNDLPCANHPAGPAQAREEEPLVICDKRTANGEPYGLTPHRPQLGCVNPRPVAAPAPAPAQDRAWMCDDWNHYFAEGAPSCNCGARLVPAPDTADRTGDTVSVELPLDLAISLVSGTTYPDDHRVLVDLLDQALRARKAERERAALAQEARDGS